MKATTVLLSFVALALVAVVVHGQSADAQESATTDREEKIESLLVERRDTLRQLLDTVRQQYEAVGSVSYATVVEAENRLLDAELELAEAHQERVRLYREKLENLRELEELLAARHARGQVTQDEVLEAKADRLAGEIDLLRAQANGG